MYKDTVTLFNRKVELSGNSLWYPTKLTGVNVNMDRAIIVKTYGEQSSDRVILNVKHNNNYVAGKLWLPPKDWQRSAFPASAITFAVGSKFDFFWVGEWPGSDIISDESYGLLSFYDYMNQNYDNVFAVTGVSYFTVIPHFEITGK